LTWRHAPVLKTTCPVKRIPIARNTRTASAPPDTVKWEVIAVVRIPVRATQIAVPMKRAYAKALVEWARGILSVRKQSVPSMRTVPASNADCPSITMAVPVSLRSFVVPKQIPANPITIVRRVALNAQWPGRRPMRSGSVLYARVLLADRWSLTAKHARRPQLCARIGRQVRHLMSMRFL
jgi:hypothetical protein